MVVLLAQDLGAQGYGQFVAALAVVGFFTPLAALGLGPLLLRDGARQPQTLPRQVGMALALWWPAVWIFSLIAALIAYWSLPTALPLGILAAFALGEVLSTSLIELAGRIAQSQQRVRTFGVLQAGLMFARLFALLVYAALFAPSPSGWMMVYSGISLIYAAFVATRLVRAFHPLWPEQRNWALIKEGFPFTAGALSFRLQAEFNKPVLAQLGYAQAGAYGIAQRLIDLASLPLTALQEALWPRVFAAQRPGTSLLHTGGFLVLLALGIGGALAWAAPLLVWLLGFDYGESARVLTWLAFFPAVQVLRNLANAWLIAQKFSQSLLVVHGVAVVAGVSLTLWLIPRFGLAGAAWAMYGSEMSALFVQWALAIHHRSTQIKKAKT